MITCFSLLLFVEVQADGYVGVDAIVSEGVSGGSGAFEVLNVVKDVVCDVGFRCGNEPFRLGEGNEDFINFFIVNVYFHPWEFIDLNCAEFNGKLPFLVRHNSGKRMRDKLRSYILWCKKKKYCFSGGDFNFN